MYTLTYKREVSGVPLITELITDPQVYGML